MAYVEPCCCERQLPRLLKEQGMAFFQTNGDVMVKHLMKSVGCMVKNGCEMWLIAAEVDVALLRTIRHWVERGWIARLKVLTREDCTEMMGAELAATADGGTSVAYGCDENVSGGLLAFMDGKNAVVAQGEMLLRVTPGMKMYSACIGAVEGERVKGATEAAGALMRARCKEIGGAAVEQQHTEQEREAAAGAERTQKRKTRKKDVDKDADADGL